MDLHLGVEIGVLASWGPGTGVRAVLKLTDKHRQCGEGRTHGSAWLVGHRPTWPLITGQLSTAVSTGSVILGFGHLGLQCGDCPNCLKREKRHHALVLTSNPEPPHFPIPASTYSWITPVTYDRTSNLSNNVAQPILIKIQYMYKTYLLVKDIRRLLPYTYV